jgi:hypothetical protein
MKAVIAGGIMIDIDGGFAVIVIPGAVTLGRV